MKKLIFILGGVIFLFGLLVFFTNISTVKLPNDSSVTPEELRASLEAGEDSVVYFFSPDCAYCQQTTPIIVPITEDKGIDLKAVDIKKHQEPWREYSIEGTPTLIHFKDGKEVSRVVGLQEEEIFKQWFSSTQQ